MSEDEEFNEDELLTEALIDNGDDVIEPDLTKLIFESSEEMGVSWRGKLEFVGLLFDGVEEGSPNTV